MARKKINPVVDNVLPGQLEMQFTSLKYKYHKILKEDVFYPVITQPSMSFTPRQIIEQFATGEIIAQENHPTDDFYDDKFTEDQLFALHMIEDDFQLRQYVLDYYENQAYEKENVNTGAAPSEGSDGAPKEVDSPVQSTEPGEQE